MRIRNKIQFRFSQRNILENAMDEVEIITYKEMQLRNQEEMIHEKQKEVYMQIRSYHSKENEQILLQW